MDNDTLRANLMVILPAPIANRVMQALATDLVVRLVMAEYSAMLGALDAAPSERIMVLPYAVQIQVVDAAPDPVLLALERDRGIRARRKAEAVCDAEGHFETKLHHPLMRKKPQRYCFRCSLHLGAISC